MPYHLKSGFHTSATIRDCKIRNITEFVSRELQVGITLVQQISQTAIEPNRRIEIISISTTHLRPALEVTPTTFWLKCKNLPKCTKFCSTRKLEVAAKNFGLLTKNRLMYWCKYRGLKAAYQAIFVLYVWIFELKFYLWQQVHICHIATNWSLTISADDNWVNLGLKSFSFLSESINV